MTLLHCTQKLLKELGNPDETIFDVKGLAEYLKVALLGFLKKHRLKKFRILKLGSV